jgi:uncharacterized membrane-anchored protein
MSRKVLFAALAFPLLVLALGIGRAEHHLRNSKKWVFEVTGYDPRDLLRGQYIQFRIALHETAAPVRCDDHGPESCCFCLTGDASDVPPRVERTTCANALPRCDGVLQTRYLTELQRYYIPEARAAALNPLFQRAISEHTARIVVAIDADGKPQIDALLIGGKRIESVH